ncbi:MAG: tetratricopeptide repeat protein [Treponema sp.]|jgi:tetratricopeptide (TPR) repeat protein|nr:tetratricopeptide repeat protein [Treponema sp.]
MSDNYNVDGILAETTQTAEAPQNAAAPDEGAFSAEGGLPLEVLEVSELSKKGYQLLKENKISDAVDCFAKILEVDENNNYALVGMGDATRKRGSFREAVVFYQRCLVYHPGNNYALFGLADCYKALNQFHKAIEIWEQYLLHDDRNITVLTRVADAYRKVRDFKHSKAVYLRVLEMEEWNPYAIIGLGHLHYDFKEYRDALFYWEKMFQNNKDNVDIRVLTSIGNCHRKLKTFAEGVEFFEKALRKEPYNFYALFGLADCYRGMNLQERSLEYWNRILEQDPRNKVILTRAGDAYRHLDNYGKAVEYYERALNIEFDTYAVLGLAVVAKAQGKFAESSESLKRLIQQDPKNYRLFLELADCYIKTGDKRAAIEVLENFQKLGIRNGAVSDMLERIQS